MNRWDDEDPVHIHLYDNGGRIARGITDVVNNTTEPHRILTAVAEDELSVSVLARQHLRGDHYEVKVVGCPLCEQMPPVPVA